MSEFHPPAFRIAVSSAGDGDGDGVSVAVAGELDVSTAPAVEAALREQLAKAPVRLDLHELSFMDSSGIRLLDGVLRDLDRMGWTLEIDSDLQPAVRRVIDVTGMTAALPFADAAPDGAGR